MGESIAEVAAGLTKHEADLLANRCTGWGSWMWGVANDLCAKGLMKKTNGTKIHLTARGQAVSDHLISQGADHDR